MPTTRSVGEFSRQTKEVSLNLHYVKRQYLLGCILNPGVSDSHNHIALYDDLRASATWLREALIHQPFLDPVTYNELSLTADADTGTVEGKIEALIICEAAILAMEHCSILTHFKTLGLLNSSQTRPNYWLVVVACWSNSLTLLRHLGTDSSPSSMNQNLVRTIAAYCLPLAIRRRSTAVIDYILEAFAAQGSHEIDGERLIAAAASVGDWKTIEHILQNNDSILSFPDIIKSLYKACPIVDDTPGYIAVVRLLLPLECIERLRKHGAIFLMSCLSLAIIEVGGVAAIDLLTEAELLEAWIVHSMCGQRSALDKLSQQGDLKAVQKLFEVDYFGCMKREHIDTAIIRAARTALDWNHAEIFEELGLHTDELQTVDWIPSLATADSTLHRLQDQSQATTEVLNAPIAHLKHSQSTAGQDTIGTAALARAMQCLKSTNVEYFLCLGIRLKNRNDVVTISWSYGNRNRTQLLATQQALAKYGLPPIAIDF